MNEIKADIYRSIKNIPFVIGVSVMVIIIAIGIGTKQLFPQGVSDGLMPYYHANIILSSLSSDIVLMAIPILCTLPYTATFLDEYNSGYIKVYLMKCDKSRYIRGKVLAPAISGGLCLVVGILIAYFIGALAYSPLEIADEMAVSPFLEVFKKCLLFIVCGALWSSVGALLANVSLSKYMAYASPFVIFYVLVILSERYFSDIYVISPKEWLKMENYWPLGEWGVILLMGILTFIVCMINEVVIERRINNG